MILVGMTFDKKAFLRFNVLIAEEISSLVTFLKGKTFVCVCYALFYSNYAWVIIVIGNITFIRLIVKNIYTKIRNSINEIVIEKSQPTIFHL